MHPQSNMLRVFLIGLVIALLVIERCLFLSRAPLPGDSVHHARRAATQGGDLDAPSRDQFQRELKVLASASRHGRGLKARILREELLANVSTSFELASRMRRGPGNRRRTRGGRGAIKRHLAEIATDIERARSTSSGDVLFRPCVSDWQATKPRCRSAFKRHRSSKF